jgi:integrase
MENVMTVDQWKDWKMENKKFPLTVHDCGQWVKRLDGQMFYLGNLNDRKAALKKWKKILPYIRSGIRIGIRRRRGIKKKTDGITVSTLLKRHESYVNSMVKKDRLKSGTQRALNESREIIRKSGMLKEAVSRLRPDEYSKIAEKISATGNSLNTQGRMIGSVRSICKWGADMGYYPTPIFGLYLKRPSGISIAREREAAGIVRFIDRKVILGALEIAKPAMRSAILLGINCGFNPIDSLSIPLTAIHVDELVSWHTFSRVKTLRRRAAVLWNETIEALESKLPNWETPIGLNNSFRSCMRKAGVSTPKGVGIGSLRHTFASVINDVQDQAIIDLAMGHTSKNMQKRIYAQVNLNELKRLKILADAAHNWLYGGK